MNCAFAIGRFDFFKFTTIFFAYKITPNEENCLFIMGCTVNN